MSIETDREQEDLDRQAAQVANSQRIEKTLELAHENWLNDGEVLAVLDILRENAVFRHQLGHAMYHERNGELCRIVRLALNEAAYMNARNAE